MRVSARSDYACKALLELSSHWPNKEPVQLQVISDRQNIPVRYLVQILIQLKRAGLVESSRGKDGGYNLSKPPTEIRLGELMRQTSGALLPVANSATSKTSVFATVWDEVDGAISKVLDNITFDDILKRSRGMKNAIIYQI